LISPISLVKQAVFAFVGKSFNDKTTIMNSGGILLVIPKGCEPSQEVPEKLKRWLDAEGIDWVQLIGEFARNTLFSYHVTLHSGTELTVLQPSNKKDSITVSATLFLSEEQSKRLRQKPQCVQEDTLSDLCFKLAPLDVELTFEGGEIYRRIGINHQIYFDGLTKDRFFKAVSIVNRAYRLADWILEQQI
jgi:hypothetical protein